MDPEASERLGKEKNHLLPPLVTALFLVDHRDSGRYLIYTRKREIGRHSIIMRGYVVTD
jgi:hypothetical protein